MEERCDGRDQGELMSFLKTLQQMHPPCWFHLNKQNSCYFISLHGELPNLCWCKDDMVPRDLCQIGLWTHISGKLTTFNQPKKDRSSLLPSHPVLVSSVSWLSLKFRSSSLSHCHCPSSGLQLLLWWLLEYSHALHNVSVNGRPHIRWWCRQISTI